ncbi:hypothetical protein [Photobacterium nomapromontoriensis]|uniref:hypothetical protein n=1 Tax=Photobacterium nomapromontoriensis TaxID=2910237 RepID=UPI003D096386
MFLWIGIVVGLLIASAFNAGLTSALFDFFAFLILLILGVRRATASHSTKGKTSMLNESNEQSPEKIDLAP